MTHTENLELQSCPVAIFRQVKDVNCIPDSYYKLILSAG